MGTPEYEVVVVGGGPAGLTTALYTTRLGHRTAVVNRKGGRYTTVNYVHNLLGISEETSGAEITELGIRQLEEYGADYYQDDVEAIERTERRDGGGGDGGDGDDESTSGAAEADASAVEADADDGRFRVSAEHADLLAERVVLATGFSDESPGVSGLQRFVGHGLHYCLHCDAYSLGDQRVFVLGHDDHAAHVAMVMLNFTAEVDLVLNGQDPTWDDDTDAQVRAHPLEVVEQAVVSVFPDDERAEQPWLGGLEFTDGTEREYGGGFAVYGRRYHNDLAEQLGCELRDDGAIAVDEDRQTSVEGVYAVGDVTHGQNQTPIALGDGAYAGIAIHRDLRTYPVPAEDIDGDALGDERPVPAMADDLRARMRRARQRDEYAGLTPPKEFEL